MPVTTTIRDSVAVIAVDNPPVNALSPGVPDGHRRAPSTRRAGRRRSSAIVFMGAGRTFVAGADINSLERAAWGDREAACDMHPLLARIEDCAKPVVMAIHGTALGGGLEIAMAGHFRVAVPDALIGQPEVNLGIIPGAEGTQRLPRLVGVEKALDMCVTGKPLKARDAHAAGLIDRVVDGDLVEGAVRFARNVGGDARASARPASASENLGSADENAALFAAARAAGGEDPAPAGRAAEGRRRDRSGRDAAVRRGLPARARAVLRVRRDRAGEGADSSLLRRARVGEDRRAAAADARPRPIAQRRDRRRRHDGRRHRHGLRQRRAWR